MRGQNKDEGTAAAKAITGRIHTSHTGIQHSQAVLNGDRSQMWTKLREENKGQEREEGGAQGKRKGER